MYFPISVMRSAATWQKAGIAYGQMMFSANQVIAARMMQMALGMMRPEEATRMFLEKPSAYAKAWEMAARSAAANRGYAAATLAGIKPIGSKTRSNAKRLTRTTSRKGRAAK